MKTKKPIAILGAGIAGLTAANFLKKENHPFVLFEAGSKIAGLASTFRDAEGLHMILARISSQIDLLLRLA